MTIDLETRNSKPTTKGRFLGTARAARPILAAILLAAAFAGGVVTNELSGDQTSSASSSMVDHPDFETVQEVWDLVHDEFVDPDLVNDEALLYGAARGMVESLGDTGHSAFLDPQEAAAFRASLSGELIGLGISIEYVGRQPVVVAPVRYSPAEKAGIEPDDIILEIDGVATLGMSDAEVSALLRGDVGTSVTLTIERPSDESIQKIEIVRDRIDLDPVSWAALPDRKAIIQLHEFSAGASTEFKEALEQIHASGNDHQIVLDLRNNPGGLVSEAIGIASQFMPEGTTIYLHEDRDSEPLPVNTVGVDGLAYDLPVVVLINRGSASAAEIVAAALRDNGRAILIGERTYGTGTVVSTYDLDGGAAVALGTAFWRTPKGELAWKKGIVPDQEISLPDRTALIRIENGAVIAQSTLDSSGDEQLIRALQALSSILEH